MADGKVVISTALDNSGIKKDAGQLTSIVKGTLGGLAKVTAGITTSIVAAFGAAAVAITKQAVDAYADREQLLGGVETLFKDSANKVVEYAEDAFYTVGISANEYMETVTSFSASLISALGGDTTKAADVADMALTDMADNANKMGSSLEGIKNAYQGFAKQNYTMLDNLKLGYGGTKTEMERLLSDAQKLTGIKYNIDNLADVYNAIHAIQVEMGIAGTTAKEAEKTITGSANMTKAAWKNVLAAIAGGGDLDKAINNLVYSVSRYFDNIVPVVERSLSGIGELIEQVAPMLVQTVAAALIKAIPSLLNAVFQMIIGLANGIYQGIVALFSGSTKEITSQLNSTDALADSYNDAAEGASNLADATEEADKAAKKSLAGFDEITKLSGGDKKSENEASGGATDTTPAKIAVTAPVTVDSNLTDVITPKLKVLAEKIKEFGGEITKAFKPTIDAWGDAFRSLAPAAEEAWKRISGAWGSLWKNSLEPFGKYIITDFVPSIANEFSQTFAPVFEDAMPAAMNIFATGFENDSKVVEKACGWMKKAFKGVKTAFSDMCKSISTNWSKYGEGLLQGFTDFYNSLWEIWWSIYDSIIDPVFSKCADTFTWLWDEHLKPLWDNIVEFAMSVGENILALWNGCLKPIIDWIIAFLAPAITGAIDLIVGWVSYAAGLIADIIGGIATFLDGVIQFVVGVFTLDWERAWGGIVKVFEGLWNGIVGIVKGVVNTIIWTINALIAVIYAAIAGVVNGVGSIVESFGDLLGQEWGFSVPTNPPQIPYLAKGAVLPPNKPFLAMVGDQTHGTNVEAPLATIQEAVALVMEDMTGGMMAGFEATVAVLKEILEAVYGIEVGDDVIGRAVARYNAKMAIARGGV